MRSMKRTIFMWMTLFIVALVAAAGPCAVFAAEKTLTVFAAASMTESLNQIAEMYKKIEPNVKIQFNYDSSGTLKTQIQQGAVCDIFISAGQKQMDQIDIQAKPAVNTERLDFVMSGTRFNIVSNSVVLIVPKGKNTTNIRDFNDVTTNKVRLIALGNSDVPVGQYSKDIFTYLKIWDKINLEKKISFASNVKEVLSQVAAGAVSCGVVYSTDAATSKGVDVVANAPAGSHRPITYPAAVLKNTRHKAEAEAFAAYLKGDAAKTVFRSIGFIVP